MTQPASEPEPYFPTAAVIGAGSWGTALSTLLAAAGRDVTLWTREEAQVREINNQRRNSAYLPEIVLPDSITATNDLAEAARHPLVLMVTPSGAVRETARKLVAAGLGVDALLLSCSKGIEAGTGLRMSQVIASECPGRPIAALSGPNHAEEVARGLATAAVVGAADHQHAIALQHTLRVPWFRLYTSTDVAGIELGGAIKNLFAIAGGMVDGLGLGDNAKAALVTRGLAEMTRLGVALGGRPETFFGLSGVGDLVVTCYSEHSRNHRAGRALGRGLTLQQVLAEMAPMIAEGIPNSASIHEVATRACVSTPIIDEIHSVIHLGKPPADALRDLLSRQPRPETDAHP